MGTVQNLGVVQYEGSNIAQGKAYHSFDGFKGSSHRGSVAPRVKLITDTIKVKGHTGLDLGCSVGGVSLHLAAAGAKMTGIDYDPQAIAVGREYAKKSKLPPTFVCEDITLETIRTYAPRADFVVWFSQWMWFVKAHGLEAGLDAIWEIGRRKVSFFFETSLGDGMAGKVMRHHGINAERMTGILNDCFVNVRNLGIGDGWRNRPVWYCHVPQSITVKAQPENRVIRLGSDRVMKMQPSDNAIREAAALRALSGPHFPRLLHADEECIVMEYAGQQLHKLPPDWQTQEAEILAGLTAAGIIHRDIRPANLCIRNGVIKLIDFSWAGPIGEDSAKLPSGLGSRYKAPDGFSDDHSLRSSLLAIKMKRAK